MNQLVLFHTLLESMPIGRTVVGVVKGTKMDPNYVVIDMILPKRVAGVIVYKPRLTFLPLTKADLSNITSFEQFQQTYPEYFI